MSPPQPPPYGPRGPGFPGPPGPRGPGFPRPNAGPPPKPWLPPARRRSKAPLFVILAFGAAATLAIGVAYYASDYRPRKILQDWAIEAGTPAGHFLGGDQYGDNHQRYLRFSEQCGSFSPCAPAPADAITAWIDAQGPGVTKENVENCFSDIGYLVYYHEGHHAQVTCQRPADGTVDFSVTLYY